MPLEGTMTHSFKSRAPINLDSAEHGMHPLHAESVFHACGDIFPTNHKPLTTTYAIGRSRCLLVLVAVLLAVPIALAAPSIMPAKGGGGNSNPQRELIFEGMASYGNYHVFGAAESSKLYLSGVEYDRELWFHCLRARVDYVSEILPVLFLIQPSKADIWGNALSSSHVTVPGAGVTPIGFRLLWRDGRRWMPYFDTKASVLVFTQKALSPDATYENWSFHSTGGLKIKLSTRYDLRLGMLSDLHLSNAFVVRSNPGLDVMNFSIGIVYHIGKRGISR